MSKHFNNLTPAEHERLVILNEECAEVQQAISKILRHGYESTNPTIPDSETNREALERELGDLFHAARRLIGCADVHGGLIEERAQSKPRHILPYLHHQPEVS